MAEAPPRVFFSYQLTAGWGLVDKFQRFVVDLEITLIVFDIGVLQL